MILRSYAFFGVYATILVGCTPSSPNYPETRTADVLDTYHGVEVPDPYRWLEELDSPEVASWVEAQNAVSHPYLSAIAGRDAIEARLTELLNFERYESPERRGDRVFFFHNDGLQDQSILFVQDGDGEARVLLDPNALRNDATVSLGGYAISPDGSYLAYGLSDGGTDWRAWHIRDVESGNDLPEVLSGAKFSIPIAWMPDNSGIFYSRYPEAADGSYDDALQPRTYFHRLETPQGSDRLVFEVTDHPTRAPYYNYVTDDGRYHLIGVYEGPSSNGLVARDPSRPEAPARVLVDGFDARYNFVGNVGSTILLHTTNAAPNGRVIGVDVENPDVEHWREIVPESDSAIQAVTHTGRRLFVHYLQNATSQVRVFDESGTHAYDVPLPGLGTVTGFGGTADARSTFFGFASFTTPGILFEIDIATGEPTLWREMRPAGLDPDDFVVDQVFFHSRDGTRVPMFVVHRHDVVPDGGRPVLLFGYGGFGVAQTPSYSTSRLVWLEMGGVFALANLRGGGEYGESWHLAGTKLQKQNVFDDFIAAAEFLISAGWTRPEKLAIEGGSNGGLLVGAVMTQRPDLFGAAHTAVGVLDMLRYHTPSANARLWSGDYGLSEDSEEFEALHAYSPVHNVEQGVCYPSTLITTADHDDRVAPWHSFKFAAELQRKQACDNPILLRVETRAGHGSGTPTWMAIEQIADRWAFLSEILAM